MLKKTVTIRGREYWRAASEFPKQPSREASKRSSTIVISDWLQNCRTEQWTPFEAATALKAALGREGYTVVDSEAGLSEAHRWSRLFKSYWCVVDRRGTAYLVSARIRRSKSIAAFIDDVASGGDWPWWRRHGYSCQRVDIKVRSAALASRVKEG